jgi:hypothetical protein
MRLNRIAGKRPEHFVGHGRRGDRAIYHHIVTVDPSEHIAIVIVRHLTLVLFMFFVQHGSGEGRNHWNLKIQRIVQSG